MIGGALGVTDHRSFRIAALRVLAHEPPTRNLGWPETGKSE
jgi:hypothetical protein